MDAKILTFSFFLIFLFILFQSYEKTIYGKPKIIDGDTIHIGKNKIRLHGIDAPERNQKCFTSNNEWDCGKESTNSLIGLINSRKVSCIILDQDRYKRDIGECYINNLNINKWMVQNGWALAYRYYSKKYVEVENLAKENNSGLWVREFENPWDFRKKN